MLFPCHLLNMLKRKLAEFSDRLIVKQCRFFYFGDGKLRQAEAWNSLLAAAVEVNALVQVAFMLSKKMFYSDDDFPTLHLLKIYDKSKHLWQTFVLLCFGFNRVEGIPVNTLNVTYSLW